MDEAVERAVDHAGPEGVMETTGNGLNYQFRGMETDDDGNTIARIGRLDVNPSDSHVAQNGLHLNLETQINGNTVSNIHIPIPSRDGTIGGYAMTDMELTLLFAADNSMTFIGNADGLDALGACLLEPNESSLRLMLKATPPLYVGVAKGD